MRLFFVHSNQTFRDTLWPHQNLIMNSWLTLIWDLNKDLQFANEEAINHNFLNNTIIFRLDQSLFWWCPYCLLPVYLCCIFGANITVLKLIIMEFWYSLCKRCKYIFVTFSCFLVDFEFRTWNKFNWFLSLWEGLTDFLPVKYYEIYHIFHVVFSDWTKS